MKLLLVEDDEKIAAAVKRGLEAEGFHVEVASDGDEGFWRASESAYDLVLLDILLPRRNGFRVCADLRAAGVWTPILVLTAKDGDLDLAEALDTGADDVLVKPFSFVVLVARIRALLRGRRRSASPSRTSWETFGSTSRQSPCCGAVASRSGSLPASTTCWSSWSAGPDRP